MMQMIILKHENFAKYLYQLSKSSISIKSQEARIIDRFLSSSSTSRKKYCFQYREELWQNYSKTFDETSMRNRKS